MLLENLEYLFEPQFAIRFIDVAPIVIILLELREVVLKFIEIQMSPIMSLNLPLVITRVTKLNNLVLMDRYSIIIVLSIGHC